LTIQKWCIDYDNIKTIDGKFFETYQEDCYALGLPTDDNNIKTIDEKFFEIYQEACYALGLPTDDKEYIDAIKKASEFSSTYQLRRLFVTLLAIH